jgi:hypothetical protein
MIADQYIKEGIRIRKTYITNLKEILKKEPLILEKKKVFEKLQVEVQSIVNSDINEIRKTMELTNKMIGLEKEIKAIQDIIKPFYEVIENLKNDKDTLYLSIIEKYPNITQQEIEREIMSKVSE